MSKPVRIVSALGAVFFAIVGLAACGGGVPGNAVVQIAGTPIGTDAFNHWMGVAATSNALGSGGKPVIPVPPNYTACIEHEAAIAPKPAKGQAAPTTAQLKKQCETQYKSLQQEVLNFLISSQWVLGEAGALGVKVSDKEVHSQFVKIRTTQFPSAGEFQRFLASSGQTISDLLLRVKLNLLSTKIQQKIVKQKATITQAQVEKYYNANKSRFGTPESRDVNLILVKTEAAAQSAKKEIESGKSFASVAKRVSIDPASKNNGGLIAGLTKGTQTKALEEAEFAAKLNALTGPVKTAFGYYVFEVKKVTPGTQQPLSQVQASIKAQLATTNQQEALTKFVKEFKSRWKGKTECRSGYVVPDCKEYKAPKGGAASPVPAEG